MAVIGLSSSKIDSILTDVQLNPEIGVDDSEFVRSVISRAARFLISQVHLDRYPELSQGYSESGVSASTDISSVATNEILVSIDGDNFQTITLTLAGLTSGAAIATELQAQIRAIGTGSYKFVTVTFDSVNSKYTILSPSYGETSSVFVSYDTELEHVALELKLSPIFGGTEFYGGDGLPEYDDMVIALVTHWYNRVGVEGMKEHMNRATGGFIEHDIEPQVKSFIQDNRRLIY